MNSTQLEIFMQIDQKRHLEDGAIEGYAMSSLSEDAAAEVEMHLLICDTCRGRVSEGDGYVRAMKSAAQLLPAEPERSRWSFRFLAPAFTVCALAVVLVGAFVIPRTGDHSPATVQLLAMRGSAVQAQGPSRRPLVLQPDLRGLPAAPAYHIEMVDATGSLAWQGTLAVKGQTATSLVPPQPRGIYFVRISLPSGQLLREYAMELRGRD